MSIDDEDKALFRNAVSGIRPLKRGGDQHRSLKPSRPSQIGQAQTVSDPSDPGEELTIGDVLRYLRPGHDLRLLRKLQQGKFPPQATLDLHGCSRSEAKPLLDAFLTDCLQDGLRNLLIIHGKGWRSEGFRPVLKTALNQWLPHYPCVLAFCSAATRHGGNGAVYVLLD